MTAHILSICILICTGNFILGRNMVVSAFSLTLDIKMKLTYELSDRVVFSLGADCACNAIVLQDGQEELYKI